MQPAPNDPDIQQQFYQRGYGGSAPKDFLTEAQTSSKSNRHWRVLNHLRRGSRLLDVGCGDGTFLYLARQRYDLLHGIDIVEDRLDVARAWADEVGVSLDLHCMNVDLAPLPYGDEMFDAVVCIAVIEFVFDPIRLIKEMHRVLKPGAQLILQLGNIASWRNRLLLLCGKQPYTTKFQGSWNGGALHFFASGELRCLLEKERFHIEAHSCSGRLYRLRSVWPSLLGSDIILAATKTTGSN